MTYSRSRSDRFAALRIVVIYALFASLWIYFSDQAMASLSPDTAYIVRISELKGFLFVIVTGILLYQLITRQIRKSKYIEEKLHLSQNLISALIDGTTDIIYVKDRQGRYLMLNSTALNFTGKVASEVIGSDDTKLFPAEDARVIMDADRKVMDAGKALTYEERVPSADGTYRIFLATKGPVFDSNGEISGLFGIARDITDRKRAEDEIRTSERHFHALFDNMLEGFAYCRMLFENGQPKDFLYLDVNAAFERLTGLKNVVGKKVSEIIPSIYIYNPELFEVYGRVAVSGKPERFETYVAPLNEWYSFYVYSPEKGCFVVIFDVITQRKQAEEKLQQLSRKLKLIINSTSDGIYGLNMDGKVTFINSAGARMLGWDQKELVGKSSDAFWPHSMLDDASLPEQECGSYIMSTRSTKGIACTSEIGTFRKKDGTCFSAEYTSAPIYDNQLFSGRVVTFRDITRSLHDEQEKEKLENQFRQAQKMEVIGHLAGGIAHDFNNILTAIIGYGNLLNMKLSTTDPLRNYVKQILASSEKAANLTHSLLAFSRKQVINPMPVNVNEIVLGMKKILERIIGEDIEFNVETSDHDLIVKSDKGQIEQVLMNLATNARDAMPHGGMITMITDEAVIDELFVQTHQYGNVGRYALVSVTDTGVGMDKATQEHLFEPFFTTKEVGKGTGLGLAMVYGTIKQHDGFINVYSESGIGTTLKIYIPLAESHNQDTKKPALANIISGNETLLLVEDDPAVRKVTKTLLEELGYSVIEAVDGEQAVKLFKENIARVQLVVSDMIMPKLSGKDVYDELKKIKPDIKTLFISGYTADILKQKGIENEKINFISKPLRADALSRKIREILSKQYT
jgi:two-component system cell cycle sensor histidine kinase/response regulator CckA